MKDWRRGLWKTAVPRLRREVKQLESNFRATGDPALKNIFVQMRHDRMRTVRLLQEETQ